MSPTPSTEPQPPGAENREQRPSREAGRARGPRRSPQAIFFVLAAALLFGLALAFALKRRKQEEADLREHSAAAAVAAVAVVHPQALATTEEIALPGSAQAFQAAPLYARTSGYLKAWHADIGTRVKQGEVLAEIEAPELDRQLEQARADAKNAEANLELSQITATRAEDLVKRNTISRQEHDQAVSDLSAKRALVDSGVANVKRLEQLRSFEQIVAPFDGVITARNTDVGALIQAGDTSSARELFHIEDNHILRVYFSVPEVYAAAVKAGSKLVITFDTFPGEKFSGDLVRDSATIDPRSHTLMVEADVDNSSGRLLAGGYATVHLKLPVLEGTFSVPSNTLLFRAEGPRVASVREGRVALIPIQIGRDHGQTLEVTGEISAADAVIIDPSDSLLEGATVTAKEAARPKPASGG